MLSCSSGCQASASVVLTFNDTNQDVIYSELTEVARQFSDGFLVAV